MMPASLSTRGVDFKRARAACTRWGGSDVEPSRRSAPADVGSGWNRLERPRPCASAPRVQTPRSHNPRGGVRRECGHTAADAGASSKENVPPPRASAADAEPAVDASDPRADVAPTSDSSDDSDADADAGAAYEREREARIARNRERMRSLGIDAMGRRIGDASDGAGKRPARRPRGSARAKASRPAPTQPTRRSTRAARRAGVVIDDVSSDVLAALGETDDALVVARASQSAAARPAHAPVHEAIELETFDDSSVRRYACRAARPAARRRIATRARRPGRRRFRRSGDVVFVDSSVKKGFYSLDATRDGALLVGGGDGGRVSIFAARRTTRTSEGRRARERGRRRGRRARSERGRETPKPRVSAPLMSWAAHRGWCSQVQFADESRTSLGVEGVRSVSAPPAVFPRGGMDGAVSLWDVSVAGVATGRPAEIARADDLHAGGIFSAHVARGPSSRDGAARVLTGSKDASACVSRWGGSGRGRGRARRRTARRRRARRRGAMRSMAGRFPRTKRRRHYLRELRRRRRGVRDGRLARVARWRRKSTTRTADDPSISSSGRARSGTTPVGSNTPCSPRGWTASFARGTCDTREDTREETMETRDDAWDGPDESPFARVAAERARGPRPATTMEDTRRRRRRGRR